MRKRSWLVLVSLCLIAGVILSGCLGVKTPPVSRTQPPGIVVDYQRSGGIAGMNDRVVIFDNGAALISTRSVNTEITVNQTDLDSIDAIFTQAKFSGLEGNYTSGRNGADLFQYRISYRGKTVNTEDTAIPAALEPVIDAMNQMVSVAAETGSTSSPLPRISP